MLCDDARSLLQRERADAHTDASQQASPSLYRGLQRHHSVRIEGAGCYKLRTADRVTPQ